MVDLSGGVLVALLDDSVSRWCLYLECALSPIYPSHLVKAETFS